MHCLLFWLYKLHWYHIQFLFELLVLTCISFCYFRMRVQWWLLPNFSWMQTLQFKLHYLQIFCYLMLWLHLSGILFGRHSLHWNWMSWNLHSLLWQLYYLSWYLINRMWFMQNWGRVHFWFNELLVCVLTIKLFWKHNCLWMLRVQFHLFDLSNYFFILLKLCG